MSIIDQFVNTLSRPLFQPLLDFSLRLHLKLMNIGSGQSVTSSGEKNVVKLLRALKKGQPAIVFDVGAHTGEWYGMFKSEYSSGAMVYSFEPSVVSYEQLKKLDSDQHKSERMAFGDFSGLIKMEGVEAGDVGSQVVAGNASDNPMDLTPIDTLDGYCQKNNIKQIDLLKLDVEGYELKVLQGSKKMIDSGSISMIQFEFGAPSQEKYTFKDFFELLSGRYDIYRILKNGIYKLDKYSHIYEINTVTNFVAINKK